MLKIHVDQKEDIFEFQTDGDYKEVLAELMCVTGKIIAIMGEKFEFTDFQRKELENGFIKGVKASIEFETAGAVGQQEIMKSEIKEIMSDEVIREMFIEKVFDGDIESFKKFYREEFGEGFEEPMRPDNSFRRRLFNGFKDR